jgi:hypothetical protein
VVNNPIHRQIKAAYGFYNVATSVPLEKLMDDALILARNVSCLFILYYKDAYYIIYMINLGKF